MIADEEGQILEAHSVSAGLDYPGVGPEHAYLRDTGRARYESVTDAQALAAFRELSRLEGIIPALESSHAIAWLLENGGGEGYDVLCLSGRGDKDLAEVLSSMRIAKAFEAARAEGRAALMPYMMAGFPDRESSLAIAAAYADSGADLIELGVPFSDPLADGPMIHAAATAALAGGATLGSALEVCESVSDRVPVVLMVYANMVLAHGGAAEFARRAAGAGAAGAIVPDLPLGEAEEVRDAFAAAGLALVPLVAPTTPPERRARICAAAQGFVYVVSTVGTTGERDELPPALAELVAADQGRRETSRSPSASGSARRSRPPRSGEIADGVIVGSRLVRAAGEAGSPEAAADAVGAFLRETRVALAKLGSAPHGNGRHPLSGARRDDGLLRPRAGRAGRRPRLLHGAPDRRRDPRRPAEVLSRASRPPAGTPARAPGRGRRPCCSARGRRAGPPSRASSPSGPTRSKAILVGTEVGAEELEVVVGGAEGLARGLALDPQLGDAVAEQLAQPLLGAPEEAAG